MQPLIHRYNQDSNSETTNIDTYCPVSAEALLFLLLENNYDYWVGELKKKNKSNKDGGDSDGDGNGETTYRPTQKYTKGTQGGNGKCFGGWNNSAKIRFNEYVDIIEEFNKDEEKVEAYNKALKKACTQLKNEKAATSKTTKRKLDRMETDNIPLKYSLPPGMRKESV